MLTEADLKNYFDERNGGIDQAELLDYILENSDGKISRENAIYAIEISSLCVGINCKDLPNVEKEAAGIKKLINLLRQYAKAHKDEEDEQSKEVKKSTLGDGIKYAIDNGLLIPQAWVEKYNEIIKKTNENT